MAETTTDTTELTREETASLLRSIAEELDADRARVGIPVGNKDVELSPPETITVETTITERSRRLRKDTEELSLRFKWNAAEDTAESSTESNPDGAPESGSPAESDTEHQ